MDQKLLCFEPDRLLFCLTSMFITLPIMHKYLFPASKLSDWVGYTATTGQQTMADNQARAARTQWHSSVRKSPIHTALHGTGARLSHGSCCRQLSHCSTAGQTLTAVGTRVTPCVRHCLLLLRIGVRYTLPKNYWPILELTHSKCKKPHRAIHTLETLWDKSAIIRPINWQFSLTPQVFIPVTVLHHTRTTSLYYIQFRTILIRAYIKRFTKKNY